MSHDRPSPESPPTTVTGDRRRTASVEPREDEERKDQDEDADDDVKTPGSPAPPQPLLPSAPQRRPALTTPLSRRSTAYLRFAEVQRRRLPLWSPEEERRTR